MGISLWLFKSLRTGSHGPFLYMNYDDLPFLRMLVFHSYVKLPEGRGILTTRTTLNGDNSE